VCECVCAYITTHKGTHPSLCPLFVFYAHICTNILPQYARMGVCVYVCVSVCVYVCVCVCVYGISMIRTRPEFLVFLSLLQKDTTNVELFFETLFFSKKTYDCSCSAIQGVCV